MEDKLALALAIAEECHKNQVDKVGRPYIDHPKRVAEKCTTDVEKIVALLHDTMEDCGMTAQQLRDEGFSNEIVEAVCSVTRNKGEDFFDFIRRTAENEIGRHVKMHDLEDNLDVLRFVKKCPLLMDIRDGELREHGPFVLGEDDLYRMNKYLVAYRILSEIDSHG